MKKNLNKDCRPYTIIFMNVKKGLRLCINKNNKFMYNINSNKMWHKHERKRRNIKENK